jgi:tetratricopeptide (TPR) repeat protein
MLRPSFAAGAAAAAVALVSTSLAFADPVCLAAPTARAETAPERSAPARASFDAKRFGEPNAEPCLAIGGISWDLRLRDAEKLVRAADGARGDKARKLYAKAGDAYVAIWQAGPEAACKAADASQCARAGEVLYDAARAYQAAHDHARATAVRKTLSDPTYHLDGTELGKRAVYEIGGSMQALCEYSIAAEHYERFASIAPKDAKAPEALGDAIMIALALGEPARAKRRAEMFAKSYGDEQPVLGAKIALALAAEHERAGEPANVERQLRAHRDAIVRALPDQQAYVDVMLARALASGKKMAEAHVAYERAASADPMQLKLPETDDPAALRAVGRALHAVGQARLALADEARDATSKLRVTQGDAASLTRLREAVAAAEKAYARVIAIQPTPPPLPSVAASARVARLRSRVWAEAHLALGPAAAEPDLARARAANRACVDLAAKFRVLEPGAQQCAAWLERHFPAETAGTGGLAPKFLRIDDAGTTAATGPRMLDEDGEEHLPQPATSP